MIQRSLIYFQTRIPLTEELKAQGGQMGKEVVDQLWILSKDEALREIAMVEDRQKRDIKAVKETMYEEGLEDGMEKGIVQGMEKGMERVLSKVWKRALFRV